MPFILLDGSHQPYYQLTEHTIYQTERQAQLEAADAVLTQIHEFFRLMREFDEIDFTPPRVESVIRIGNVVATQSGVKFHVG
jgi:hypothetical protein